MSSINKQILSSGNPFLDKIFNGGFQLGSIILLLEDSPTKLYYQFLKYGIAEGIISGDRIMFYYGNKSTFEEVYNNLPYKSSQVENILNSQPVKVTDANEDNINSHKAWRYENINYTNLIGELSKSLKYIFDLNRPLQDNLKLSIKKELIVTKHIDFFKKNEILPFINEIVDDFENLSQEEKNNTEEIIYNRIYITNFLEFADMKKINYTEIYKALTALKNLARSLNGFVFITVNKELLDNKIFNLLQYISDYVLKIKPLLMVPDKEKVSNYDAIFHIDKFNWINNIKPLDIETNIYGIIKDKRKVIIEKIDIGVEIDRNTKVKQSDLVKTDFNDMNKNLNNLDF
jgi:archaellum biogenesis ATPase FlaH